LLRAFESASSELIPNDSTGGKARVLFSPAAGGRMSKQNVMRWTVDAAKARFKQQIAWTVFGTIFLSVLTLFFYSPILTVIWWIASATLALSVLSFLVCTAFAVHTP
jgi:hypothetical protein